MQVNPRTFSNSPVLISGATCLERLFVCFFVKDYAF